MFFWMELLRNNRLGSKCKSGSKKVDLIFTFPLEVLTCKKSVEKSDMWEILCYLLVITVFAYLIKKEMCLGSLQCLL
jgi:hypothetical protein